MPRRLTTVIKCRKDQRKYVTRTTGINVICGSRVRLSRLIFSNCNRARSKRRLLGQLFKMTTSFDYPLWLTVTWAKFTYRCGAAYSLVILWERHSPDASLQFSREIFSADFLENYIPMIFYCLAKK